MATADEPLERAALALLRKRGYSILAPEAAERRESAGTSRERLASAAKAFGILADWIAASAALVRRELLAGALPVLLHLFLALVEEGDAGPARALLADHIGLFTAAGSRREIILECLWSIRARSDLEGVELYEQFRREERMAVGMSRLAHDLLMSRLLSLELVTLADIFQRRVKVVEPRSVMCSGPLPEGADVAASEVNRSQIDCLVDALEPPEAYGKNWPSRDAQRRRGQKRPLSAENIMQRCRMPLPLPQAQARAAASARFADLAARRQPLGGGQLPSIAAYIVEGGWDDDVNCIAISCDGRYCVACALGATLWDLSHGGGVVAPSVINGDMAPVADMASRPPSHVAEETCGMDLLPAQRLEDSFTQSNLSGHHGRVFDAAFGPDAELLLTTGQDGTARLWSVPHRRALCVFPCHREPVWAVDWCSTGHYFVSGGSHGESLLWSVEHELPLRVLPPVGSAASGGFVAWPDVEVIRTHPSAQHAVVATGDCLVIWDLFLAQPARIFPCGGGGGDKSCGATSLGFSRDGSLLAVGRVDGGVEIWDIVAGKRRHEVTVAHEGPVSALDFGWPCENRSEVPPLCSCGEDGVVRLWEMDGARPTVADGSPCGAFQVAAFRAQSSEDGQGVALVGGRFTPANLLLVAGVTGSEAGLCKR